MELVYVQLVLGGMELGGGQVLGDKQELVYRLVLGGMGLGGGQELGDKLELVYRLVQGGMGLRGVVQRVHKLGHELEYGLEHEQQRCTFQPHKGYVRLGVRHEVGWQQQHGEHHEVCGRNGLRWGHCQA